MTLEELEKKVMAIPGARERISGLIDQLREEQGLVQLGTCRYCAKPLWQKRKGRDKTFCDDVCRDAHRREEAGSDATA